MRPVPDVTDLDVAFAARGVEFAPPWEEIPDEFKSSSVPEYRLFADLWGSRIDISFLDLLPWAGVEPKKAWDALRVIMSTYGLRHEHKEAAWAMCFREWFAGARWKTTDGEKHSFGFDEES